MAEKNRSTGTSPIQASNSTTMSRPGSAGCEFVITRVVDAPRELVFKAWIDRRHLAQWWGPKSFTNPVCETDARPGGAYRIVMRSLEGVEYPVKGVYCEVDRVLRAVRVVHEKHNIIA
jgi:hypothetical protein